MLMVQRNAVMSGENASAFLLLFLLIGFLIFNLLNTAVLRLAADIVVNRIPEFKKAFSISVASFIGFFCSGLIVSWIQTSSGSSVLNPHLVYIPTNSPLTSILPLALFLVSCWILNSTYLVLPDSENIGYGRGLAITILQSIFLTTVGVWLIVTAYFAGW